MLDYLKYANQIAVVYKDIRMDNYFNQEIEEKCLKHLAKGVAAAFNGRGVTWKDVKHEINTTAKYFALNPYKTEFEEVSYDKNNDPQDKQPTIKIVYRVLRWKIEEAETQYVTFEFFNRRKGYDCGFLSECDEKGNVGSNHMVLHVAHDHDPVYAEAKCLRKLHDEIYSKKEL
jgi:hypothetical protein